MSRKAKMIMPWMILIVALMSIMIMPLSMAAIESGNDTRMTYHVDEGVRKFQLNESQIQFTSQARTGTQPDVYRENRTILDYIIALLPVKFIETKGLFDFKNMTTEIIYNALSLMLNNSYGSIDFMQVIDLSSRDFYDVDRYVNISRNHIEINGTAIPEFNLSSQIIIKDISLSNLKILKDGQNCDECTIISYSNSDIRFNAPGFTVYSAENGTIRPALRISRSVNITNATMNVTGKMYNLSYPNNVTIDIGVNGSAEFNFSGELNRSIEFANFSDDIQSMIDTCSCIGCSLSANELTCTIDMNITSATQGEIMLSALNISQVIKNATWSTGSNYTLIDLRDYFYDRDGDSLVYNYTPPVGINISVTDGIVKLIPDGSYIGVSYVVFNATDGYNVTVSNNVTLNVTGDTMPPWWISIATNGSTATKINQNVSWTASIEDNVALANFVFSTNASGTWTNSSVITITGKTYVINGTANVLVAAGKVVCAMFYFNDTAQLTNKTDNSCFTIGNSIPDITSVSLSDATGDYANCTSSICTLTPVAGSNISLAAQVMVADADSNCDTNNGQVWLHLCYNNSEYTTCSEDQHNWTAWELDKVTRSGTTCRYEFTTNKTSYDNTPEFFRLPGTYKYYVNVSDQSNGVQNDAQGAGTWDYNSLAAVDYAETVILGNETVSLGTWNNGTTGYNMTNFGNALLGVNWSATDPSNGANVWILNGTDLILDNDTGYEFEAGGSLPSIYINGTAKPYNWSSGLQICASSDCSDPEINETMPTYWHIYPPKGLREGTYTTTIEYTLYPK